MINENSSKFLLPQRIWFFNLFKRSIDIFGSIFLLIIFSPIMLITAILVYRTSKNGVVAKYPKPGYKSNLIDNVIFKQKRVGNHREFIMYKFHSMYIADNDRYLKEEYPSLWERYKVAGWKLPAKDDPRITPVGRKIRALTIDEFPQLINVLKGEMSIVGPRAYRDEELKEYESKYPLTKKYIEDIRSAKPGITGLWQTSGRNDLSFEQRAKLDSNYIRNRSIRQEIIILLKTPMAMLSRW